MSCKDFGCPGEWKWRHKSSLYLFSNESKGWTGLSKMCPFLQGFYWLSWLQEVTSWSQKNSHWLFYSNIQDVLFCKVIIGCRDYRKWRHAVRSILIGWFTRIALRGAWWLSLWVRVHTWRLRGWIAGRSPGIVAASARTRSPGSPRSSCSSAGALLLCRKRENTKYRTCTIQ